MTIKSAERLVDILETWGSNLVRQIDYAGHGEYVLSGHSNSRNSSKYCLYHWCLYLNYKTTGVVQENFAAEVRRKGEFT